MDLTFVRKSIQVGQKLAPEVEQLIDSRHGLLGTRKRKIVDHQQRLRELRAKLPQLTKAEIRRHRLPLYVALVEELKEDGFPNAANFMWELYKHQERYRAEHHYDVIIQSRPVLIEDEEQLLYLFEHLKMAERAHYADDPNGEIDELLRIAYNYSFGDVDWWWLGEQIFAQCLNITEKYRADERYRYTMTYYLYGKYLIEKPRIIPLGMQFLNIAREHSKDKEWSAKHVSGQIEKYIFVEVCTVLYNTLMDQAKAVLARYPEWALELTQEARQRGIDACLPRADVFHLLGLCEMANQQAKKAVGDFMKAFLLYKSSQQWEDASEAMIGLAQAFQQMGDLAQNYQQLQKLLKFAQDHELKSYIGLAYLYIGQYYLNEGDPTSASPYLGNSLDIFHEINDVARREFVKNLGAVSKGQETFQAYVKLILRCEDASSVAKQGQYLNKLLKWKDAREPFWDDMSESSYSEVTMVEEEATLEPFMVSHEADLPESVGDESVKMREVLSIKSMDDYIDEEGSFEDSL